MGDILTLFDMLLKKEQDEELNNLILPFARNDKIFPVLVNSGSELNTTFISQLVNINKVQLF